jgi:hypothetical protein
MCINSNPDIDDRWREDRGIDTKGQYHSFPHALWTGEHRPGIVNAITLAGADAARYMPTTFRNRFYPRRLSWTGRETVSPAL